MSLMTWAATEDSVGWLVGGRWVMFGLGEAKGSFQGTTKFMASGERPANSVEVFIFVFMTMILRLAVFCYLFSLAHKESGRPASTQRVTQALPLHPQTPPTVASCAVLEWWLR